MAMRTSSGSHSFRCKASKRTHASAFLHTPGVPGCCCTPSPYCCCRATIFRCDFVSYTLFTSRFAPLPMSLLVRVVLFIFNSGDSTRLTWFGRRTSRWRTCTSGTPCGQPCSSTAAAYTESPARARRRSRDDFTVSFPTNGGDGRGAPNLLHYRTDCFLLCVDQA